VRDAFQLIVAAAAVVLTATCSSPTRPGLVVVDQLAIHSVTPATGSASGGTEVTIRGTGFATGATVTIGGRAATDVNVRSSDMVTAKTPDSAVSGQVDIVVSSGGRTTTLSGGFRYDPIAPNTSPRITSIAAQGRRLRQPAAFADYGETITVTLAVQDAESTPAQLTYQWQACGGSFNGTGPQVEWTAPAVGTLPSRCTLQVTVTDGPHVVATSIEVRLHNSIVEVGSLAREFLEEFANNLIPAATTVRNFSNSCPGKAAEQADVADVRRDYTINSYTYGTATVSVAFGGMCKTKTADACVITPVEWISSRKPSGPPTPVVGVSTISGIYRDSRWWLCDSLFDGPSTLGFFWPLQ
jgi:hypothetical protein